MDFLSIFSSKPKEDPQNSFDGELQFTLQHLKHVYNILVENKVVTARNVITVVESLRNIAEMVVYGDNNSEQLFDFFCEKNMLSLFIEIMWSPNCHIVVHKQILQTLSILCQSVKNDTSLYYLLSNNYINEIINYPHNFENDDITEHFVSLMKTLALRLNLQTVQFFFIEETGAFPLLTRAIGLLQFREPMVRIAAQAIILNVYKIRDRRSRDYALQTEIMNRFFKNIVHLMIGQYNSLVSLTLEHMRNSVLPPGVLVEGIAGKNGETVMNSPEANCTKCEELIHDLLINIEDWFFYLQDIIDLGIMKLRRSMIQYVISEFVYPVLMEPFLRLGNDHIAGGYLLNTLAYGLFDSNVMRSKKNSSFDSKSYESTASYSYSSSTNSKKAKNSSPMKALLSAAGKSISVGTVGNGKSLKNSVDESEMAISSTLVVSLMYTQMMLRFTSDEMLRRALLVALMHNLSRKERRNILVSLNQGKDSSTRHSEAVVMNAPVTKNHRQSLAGLEDLSEISRSVSEGAVAKGLVNKSESGTGVMIKIRPDYFNSTKESEQSRMGGFDDASFIRQSCAFRKTLTLSTADFGEGQKKLQQMLLESVLENTTQDGKDNVYRDAFDCCLLQCNERYSMLSLLLIHSALEKWVLHCSSAYDRALAQSTAFSQMQPLSPGKVSPSPNNRISMKRALASMKLEIFDLKAIMNATLVDRAIRSPSAEITKCAADTLWFLKGLGFFSKSISILIEEIYEWHSSQQSDEIDVEVGDKQQISSEKISAKRTKHSSKSMDSDDDSVHAPAEGNSELTRDDRSSASSIKYSAWEHNKPIPEEPDDIDIEGNECMALTEDVNGASFLSPDVLSIGKLELINMAFDQVHSSQVDEIENGASIVPEEVLVDLLQETKVVGSEIAAAVSGMNAKFDTSSGPSSLLESLFVILKNHNAHVLSTLQVSASCVYTTARLIHTTVCHERTSAKPSNTFAADLLRYLVGRVLSIYIKTVQTLSARATSDRGDVMLNVLEEELRRIRSAKWNSTLSKIGQDVLLLMIPTPTTILRMGLEQSIPISQMEVLRREVQVFVLFRNLLRQLYLLYMDASVVSELEGKAISGAKDSFLNINPSLFAGETRFLPNELFKDAIDEKLKNFASDGNIAVAAVEKPVSAKAGMDSISYGIATSDTGASVLLSEGDDIKVHEYVYVKGVAPLLYARLDMTDSPKPKINVRPSFLIGKSVGAKPMSLPTSSLVRKNTTVYFIFHNNRLLIATNKNEDEEDDKDDDDYDAPSSAALEENIPGVVRIIAPISNTDVCIDSVDKNKLQLLVRSSDSISCMTKVGTSFEDTVVVTLLNCTNDLGLVTSISSASEVKMATESRQMVSKNSPSLLSVRPNATLWQLTVTLPSPEDASAIARHVDIQRQQNRGTKLSLLKEMLAEEELLSVV